MREKTTRRPHSSESRGESGSDGFRPFEDYILNASLEVILSMCFIGMLMEEGPPAWVAYGLAGTGGIVFLVRGVRLAFCKDEIMKPPRWPIISLLLILATYGFLFFIRDQFCLMWISFSLMILLLIVNYHLK